jgi:cold shock protein
MPTGIVKWFSEEKGYGFIEQDDGGADVFVHVTDVRESGVLTLTAGNIVEFDIGGQPADGQSQGSESTDVGETSEASDAMVVWFHAVCSRRQRRRDRASQPPLPEDQRGLSPSV